MNQNRRVLLGAVALMTAAQWASGVSAAPDDEEPPPVAAANEREMVRFEVAENNFDQWIFQGAGNADAGFQRIKSRLKLQVDELDRVCGLTDVQKQKLLLAGRGDVKRFSDEVDALRQKFLAVKNDQNGFNQIWQEIQPLQTKQASGLFGDTSFFAKTLRKTLNAQQAAKYEAVLDSRRRFRYRAAVAVALATLEKSVALRHDQHQAIFKLLNDATQPPRVFGQYDYYVVMYRLSKLPEDKVKPLLDERQWKLLNQQLEQSRGMGKFLAQNGIIIFDDDESTSKPQDSKKPRDTVPPRRVNRQLLLEEPE